MNSLPTQGHEPTTSTALNPELRRRLAARIQSARRSVEQGLSIPRRDPAAPARLSLAEEQLWYLEQFLGGTPTYNISRAWRLRGPLNRAALRQSVDEVVNRHAGLRTTVAAQAGGGVRVVHPPTGAAWHVLDRPEVPPESRDTDATRLAHEAAIEPFDLNAGPLVRFQLIRFAPDDHVFGVTLHHIIADGWSLGLMLRELAAAYRTHSAGVTAEDRTPEREYADFAAWQRTRAASGAFAAALDYWERTMQDAPAMLELPTDRARPATPSYRGALARVQLDATQTAALAACGARENASLFVVLLAAFNVLLHRTSGQDDLVVGSPFASRGERALEGIVGYFANMLPLRTNLAGAPTFREVVRRVRQTVLEAADHQDVPFATIVERLRPPVRHAGLNPVFQAAFVLEEQSLVGSPAFPGITADLLSVDTGTSKFDLSLLIIETDTGLHVSMEASADLFTEATAAGLLEQFTCLVAAVTAAPDRPVDHAALMSAAERRRILHLGQGPRTSYPRDATVEGLFAEQARRRPEAIALACGERTLTYGELNLCAARLAQRLREAGVRPGEFVVVVADRSMAFVVAILATLKAGAAYVPLDPHHPGNWLARMLQEVRPAAILVAPAFREAIPPGSATLLALDDTVLAGRDDPAASDDSATVSRAHPASTAYVMFTSGSTGRPKGTVVPHRAIIRVVRGTNYARFGPAEVYLLLANLAFDASTFEIWAALLHGGKLAIPTAPQPTLAQIVEEVRRHRVTTLWLTTGLFNLLIDAAAPELVDVPQVLTGGEALSPAHVAKALAALPRTQLVNFYGPTENTVFTTAHPITAEHARGHGIPIGRPIANTSVYILDRNGEPVPVGVPGELFTGGDGVAAGYLNQPELTEERFVPDPFSGRTGARLYRTGDRARWCADGTIEFLGRIDQELKLRGFRVDPGEIEAALKLLPGVADAAVIVQADTGGHKELIGFVAAANGAVLVPAQLRDQLAARLPPHMIPAAFCVIAKMPLTSNGKIDRRTLATLPAAAPAGRGEPIPARTETERRLEALWRDLLHCDTIGMRDDFFALGGHSLLAMRLLHRIQEEFGHSLPLAALLGAPTIERLAARLTADSPAETAGPAAGTTALRGSGPGAALFFVPGLGGYEFLPAPVARALEGRHPYFDGLQIVGIDRQAEPLEDLRAIAADLVRQIRAVQATGPYNLCGYCYGGVVAFEVARQLEADGETVAALIIWHGYPVSRPWARRSFAAIGRAIAQRVRETPPRQRPRLLWDKARLAVRMFGWKLSDEWNHLLGRPRSLIPHNVFFPEEMDPRIVYANLRARGRYQPAPYRGRVFLLMGDTDRLLYECPPLAGWDGTLLGPVEIFKHTVEHMELVVPPAVDYVAAQTAACLEAAAQGTPARAVRGFTAIPSAATPAPGAG